MIKSILYITRLNPLDLKTWSGTNYFILKCLNKHFKVHTIGPLSNRIRFFYMLKRFFFSLFKKKFDIDRPKYVLKDFALQIKKKTKNLVYDSVFVTEPSLLSFINTKKPVFIWSDVVFSTYYSHYFSDKIIHPDTTNDGNYFEKISLKKSSKIFLTSKWAINDASKFYNIPLSKFSLIPFGANIKNIPSKKIIIKKIKNRNVEICKLISIGVHWDRKGMDKAVKIAEMMNLLGQPTVLYIVGASPPTNFLLPNCVKIFKFLDKNIPKDLKKLYELLYNSHFHVLLTQAEACGVVFAEASAFGLYTITHNVGGVGGMIRNNINGFKFNIKKDSVQKISKYIINIFQNKKNYFDKSLSSRIEYENRLDWLKTGERVKGIIENLNNKKIK